MKLRNILTISLLAGMLLTGAGCTLFRKQPKLQSTSPVPASTTPDEIEAGKSPWEDIETNSMGGFSKDGLEPIPNVTLPTIYFSYDRSTVGSSECHKLNQVAKYLKENTTFAVIVEGHCDEKGSAEYNRALSERRAISVRDYLVKAGVNTNRIKTMGYGEDRLAYKANTEVAHAKNRRAVLILARTR